MIYMFLSNNPSSGDINSSNLSCYLQRSNLNLLILYSNIVYLISLNNRFKSLIDGNLNAFKCIIALLKIDLLQ